MSTFREWVSEQPATVQRRVLGRGIHSFFAGRMSPGEEQRARRMAGAFGWSEAPVARAVEPAAVPPEPPAPPEQPELPLEADDSDDDDGG